MKTKFENTPGLREEGKFIFDVDGGFSDGTVVRVDGVVVHPRADGRYELEVRPRSLSSIVVEKCAGPFYSPPVRWVLAKAAYLRARRGMLECLADDTLGSLRALMANERRKVDALTVRRGKPGEILSQLDDVTVFERFVDPELEAFVEAAAGPAPENPGTCTVTAITKQSAFAQLWDDETAGAKAIAVHDMRLRGVPEAAAKAIAEGLYGKPVDGCMCPWWEEMPCPVHG